MILSKRQSVLTRLCMQLCCLWENTSVDRPRHQRQKSPLSYPQDQKEVLFLKEKAVRSETSNALVMLIVFFVPVPEQNLGTIGLQNRARTSSTKAGALVPPGMLT